MKLLFFGDCMFGRDNHPFIQDPFINVKHLLKKSTYIFFNLETNICSPPLDESFRVNKHFNYQSNGDQLLSLKKHTKNNVFVSIANNHSLDYGKKGHEETKKFLKANKFLCNSKNKVSHKNIIFLNASDHCGCYDKELWSKHIMIIDYNDLDGIYAKIKNIRKNKNTILVLSMHWGSNWVDGEMPDHIKEFGRGLIDHGVDIVYGHSAHHIPKTPIEEYKGGLIIYGLGDFINDYSVDHKYKSDHSLMCSIQISKSSLSYELIPVHRKFVEEGGSIPFLK